MPQLLPLILLLRLVRFLYLRIRSALCSCHLAGCRGLDRTRSIAMCSLPDTQLDWEAFRGVIRNLYWVQDRGLPEVMKIMEEAYGFSATCVYCFFHAASFLGSSRSDLPPAARKCTSSASRLGAWRRISKKLSRLPCSGSRSNAAAKTRRHASSGAANRLSSGSSGGSQGVTSSPQRVQSTLCPGSMVYITPTRSFVLPTVSADQPFAVATPPDITYETPDPDSVENSPLPEPQDHTRPEMGEQQQRTAAMDASRRSHSFDDAYPSPSSSTFQWAPSLPMPWPAGAAHNSTSTAIDASFGSHTFPEAGMLDTSHAFAGDEMRTVFPAIA